MVETCNLVSFNVACNLVSFNVAFLAEVGFTSSVDPFIDDIHIIVELGLKL